MNLLIGLAIAGAIVLVVVFLWIAQGIGSRQNKKASHFGPGAGNPTTISEVWDQARFLALTPEQIRAQLEIIDRAAQANDDWRGWRRMESADSVSSDLRDILQFARLRLLLRIPDLQEHGDLELTLSQVFPKGRNAVLAHVDEWISAEILRRQGSF